MNLEFQTMDGQLFYIHKKGNGKAFLNGKEISQGFLPKRIVLLSDGDILTLDGMPEIQVKIKI